MFCITHLFISYDHYLSIHKTKQLALFHAIRDAILKGKLHSHSKLPPTRKLSKQLNLSRGTVNNVYEMLLAQGYLYSRLGSGVFVSDYELSLANTPLPNTTPMLSKWGKSLLDNTHFLEYRNTKKFTKQTDSEQLPPISFCYKQGEF